MGLITKEVEIGLVSQTIRYYEKLGYIIPKRKDKQGRLKTPKKAKIIVKVKDLTKGSNVFIDVQCDCCKRILHIKYNNYNKYIHKDGQYYCQKCSNNNYNQWKSFEQWCIENNRQDVLDRWDYELNDCNPNEITYRNNKKYYFKCPRKLHKSELKQISNITNNKFINLKCNQCNSIEIQRPDLVKYFFRNEDTKKYSIGSNKKVFIICPDCKHKKLMKINKFITRGFSCPKCGDGISYPEKFMFNVLKQLDLDIISQLTKINLKWCDKYKYDFYIPNLNCIIETHGLQHYKNTSGIYIKSLKEEQENDKIKKELALNNDIINYIIIDCRYSKLEWIKNNIMQSELPQLLNFKEEDIDWLKCHEYTIISLVKIICRLWENNTSIKEIKNKFKISDVTIRKYLKQGVLLNWCNYNGKEEQIRNGKNNSKSKKVICITTKKNFTHIQRGAEFYSINPRSISTCCKDKAKSAGIHPITGEPLKWMYYEDYISLQK